MLMLKLPLHLRQSRTGWPGAGLLTLAILAVVIAVTTACAPAAGPGDGTGAAAGQVAPPFAMQLADGSAVSRQNLVDDQRPAFMMYFATW